MKKTTSALTLALLLSACAGNGGMNLGGLGGGNGGGMSATNIGSNIVKTYVQNHPNFKAATNGVPSHLP